MLASYAPVGEKRLPYCLEKRMFVHAYKKDMFMAFICVSMFFECTLRLIGQIEYVNYFVLLNYSFITHKHVDL